MSILVARAAGLAALALALVACPGGEEPDVAPFDPSALPGDVLYLSDLEHPGPWPTGPNVRASEDGLVLRPGGDSVVALSRTGIEGLGAVDEEESRPITGLQVLALDVAARRVEGTERTMYGVVCSVSDGLEYVLAVSDEGLAQIGRRPGAGGDAVTVLATAEAPAGLLRVGRTNHVRADCAIEGNRAQLTLSVNGRELLDERERPRWPTARRAFSAIGLYAENATRDVSSVLFRRVALSDPLAAPDEG